MSLKYTVVPKKNPRDLSSPPKYYPIAVSSGHTELRKIAERIALISTVSTIDSSRWIRSGNMVASISFKALKSQCRPNVVCTTW